MQGNLGTCDVFSVSLVVWTVQIHVAHIWATVSSMWVSYYWGLYFLRLINVKLCCMWNLAIKSELSLCACICILAISDETDCIEITAHPKDVQVKVNETITLRCVAHNKYNKELVYQWFKDKCKGQGITEVQCSLTFTPLLSSVAGSSEFTLLALHFKRDTPCKYYCRVSLKGCNGKFVKSEHAKVTVKVCKYLLGDEIELSFKILWLSVWFTVEPQDVDGCVGKPAILYCRASGLPAGKEITYLWLKSSTLGGAPTPLPYSSSDTLIIQNLKDSDCGYYICQASDESQFISSRSVHVTAKIQYDSDEGECLQ